MTVHSRRANKTKRRMWQRVLITIGVIFASCCACVGAIAIVDAAGVLKTPTPAFTANNSSIEALISYTQTAAAQIPITGPTDTKVSSSTETSSPPTSSNTPLQAFTPTNANTPTKSITAQPTRTPIPSFTPMPPLLTFDPLQGVTAICNDGSYSYSQHSRGTCSHHGGVQQWIHKPSN